MGGIQLSFAIKLVSIFIDSRVYDGPALDAITSRGRLGINEIPSLLGTGGWASCGSSCERIVNPEVALKHIA